MENRDTISDSTLFATFYPVCMIIDRVGFLDVGIGLEINVLTSKFILLGYQMLGEMGCHPEMLLYNYLKTYFNIKVYSLFHIIQNIRKG